MKRKFSEEEVEEWAYEGEFEEGEQRRWVTSMVTIAEVDGKFYSLNWDRGLTESQEDYYPEQEADEVEQIEETIVVKKWVIKN